MNTDEKEKLIDGLCCFMLEKLESLGCSREEYTFTFFSEIEEIEDSLHLFKDSNSLSEEDMITLLRYCYTHELLTQRYISSQYSAIELTRKGYAHAMSVIKGRNYQAPITSNNISINTLTANNVQVGNNNTQNTTQLETYMMKEIEKINATKEEKQEAKSLLQSFADNNILSGILSNLASSGILNIL